MLPENISGFKTVLPGNGKRAAGPGVTGKIVLKISGSVPSLTIIFQPGGSQAQAPGSGSVPRFIRPSERLDRRERWTLPGDPPFQHLVRPYRTFLVDARKYRPSYPEAGKLLAKIILASSRPGDLVFDPFLGSGTASVVAKNSSAAIWAWR